MLFVHHIYISNNVLSMLSLCKKILEMKVNAKFVTMQVDLLDVCSFKSSSPLDLQFHL